ncbi:MAG: M14 family zinc carboxypeptidase [Bacteroidales bacterium]
MTFCPMRPKHALAFCACLLASAALVASQKAPAAQAAATSAASAQRVPITFASPRGYAATVDYLKKVATANPSLTELVDIGKSRGGRALYVLVVSNLKAGVPIDRLVPLAHPRTPAVDNVLAMRPYHAKPGQWVDGGPRPTDGAGSEACLFIIDKLLTGYGSDPEVKRLVDDNVFYICPIVNPDSEPGVPASDIVASNFPEGWWKDDNTPGGGGDYPSSSPEARAILEFFTNHPNILLVQSCDRAAGAGLRPFARWPDARVDARDMAVFDGVIGKKYQETAGRPGTPAAWRVAYNTEKQAPAGYGVFLDWAYGQFGAFATTAPVATGEQPYEAAWQFERYKAGLLPRVQIKDAAAKVLYTASSATRATASESADTVVVRKSGTPAGRYKIVQVTATVENVGPLPTHVARGLELRGNRQDVIWLLGDRAKVTFIEGARWQPLGVLQGTLSLPRPAGVEGGRGGRGGAPGGGRGGRGGETTLALSEMREQRPAVLPSRQVGSSRTVSWLVAIEGDAPLKLALTSQKGGTVTKDLAIQ